MHESIRTQRSVSVVSKIGSRPQGLDKGGDSASDSSNWNSGYGRKETVASTDENGTCEVFLDPGTCGSFSYRSIAPGSSAARIAALEGICQL
jgi:hypothetical protein